jgi:hypothetical protein
LASSKDIVFEIEDNYQKQTYRNRCNIYSANGSQPLIIPIKHGGSSRKTKDVRIENRFAWRKQHLKSLQIAYRSSPYFEYYEDDIIEIYNDSNDFLLDFNFKCQNLILSLLDLNISFSKTEVFQKEYKALNDCRNLVNSKSGINFGLEPYTQVFFNKLGFIENLSILDLLFMEGPNALNYLEKQQYHFK